MAATILGAARRASHAAATALVFALVLPLGAPIGVLAGVARLDRTRCNSAHPGGAHADAVFTRDFIRFDDRRVVSPKGHAC